MIEKFFEYLKRDTWDSWLVSLILIVVLIKFIFFPTLSVITGSSLPLVVVESCSMYHETSFDEWWTKNSEWYESKEIAKSEFKTFPLKNGFSKGDIILVWGHSDYNLGDVIIFEPKPSSSAKHPIIHRIISTTPIGTKGDHNPAQLTNLVDETNISKEKIIGKSVFRIPVIGWIKLVFYELFKPASQRGFCK